ncbi:class E sortase [Streptomyces sp. NPDC090021]|uniref:class E sortase n=1 Tax=Streptomyces sp. NPDC090021 TaxID=3365919 RepID=UPI0037F50F86
MSFLGVVGEVLITFALLVGLLAGYCLWWTDVVADQAAAVAAEKLRSSWSAPSQAGASTGGSSRAADAHARAAGVGFLHVPALSSQAMPVAEGTGPDVLNKGLVGMYTSPVVSAMPWDRTGNVTLAAHRDGHGARFHDIHRLKPGDPIVFEGPTDWYVYRVHSLLPQTAISNTSVLDAVPHQAGWTRPGRYLTLTTCTPMYTSKYRYIVFAELERVQRVDARRTPPAELRS